MTMVTGYPRGDYISVFSDRISSEFFELLTGYRYPVILSNAQDKIKRWRRS